MTNLSTPIADHTVLAGLPFYREAVAAITDAGGGPTPLRERAASFGPSNGPGMAAEVAQVARDAAFGNGDYLIVPWANNEDGQIDSLIIGVGMDAPEGGRPFLTVSMEAAAAGWLQLDADNWAVLQGMAAAVQYARFILESVADQQQVADSIGSSTGTPSPAVG